MRSGSPVAGVPVAEAIRAAVTAHIAARRADKEFMARLRRRIEEDRQILEKLATT